jgi:hypothetical protein
MKQKHQKKSRKLFNPDVIQTRISQALRRDFVDAQQVYSINDSTTLHAFNRQVNELTKKYCSETQDVEALEKETFANFAKVNSHMLDTNVKLLLNLPWDTSRIAPTTSRIDKIHLRARALMKSVLGSFSVEEWLNECRNSSGSSLGVPYKDTSQEAKFRFPMSMTKSAESYMYEYLAFNDQLKVAIEEFNSKNPVTDWYNYVDESRATTVDKTTTKRRMICIEPTVNMFLQQGLMQCFYTRLKAVGLDVESLPDWHKEIARLSSVSCLSATIDFSSASDCVSIELLRWLLPPEWFDIVYDLRCDNTSLNGDSVRLQMISTMGNAATFPLETLVFWTYANAVQLTNETNVSTLHPYQDRLLSGNYIPETHISVFGDDCIVPSPIADEFMSVMEEVGFIVNKEKSFYDSMQFRESCGGDYLAGYDVRPFYLKAPHSRAKSALEPWLYILANSFVKKYISYFGELAYVYDKNVFRYLFALFRQHKISLKLVPPFYPDDSGFKYFDPRMCHLYGLKLSPVHIGNHGTISFRFCRFQYWKRTEQNDGIRLCLWLQRPVQSKRPPLHESPDRSRGGYVVGRGITAHWTVPSVRRVSSS